MTDDELVRFVINSTSQFEQRDEIIYELCEQTGWTWDQGADFVDKVLVKNSGRVEHNRRALMVALCIVFIVLGAVMLVMDVIMTANGVTLSIMPRGGAYSGNLALLLAGLALLLGGIVGLTAELKRPQAP